MADKSGVSESVLSLPKGGGSLKGIGETFTANPQTGTGKMTVPIQLPEGRGGLRPSLDLHYTTGAGNGAFGLGFSISVPGITRRTAKGIPRYRDFSPDPDERDVFVLSGGEELVFVSETQRQVAGVIEIRRRYRPATEGLFARIEHVIRPGRSWWEIAARDGLRSVYGDEASARVEDAGDPERVFAWQLTGTSDPFGNLVRYEYRVDGVHNQSYLTRVLWVNYRLPGGGKDDFLYAVELDYGGMDEDGRPQADWDERDDSFAGYRSGFEIRTARRCERLLVKLKEEGEADYDLLREYRFGYTAARGNGVALLTSVELRGHAPKRPSDVPGTTLSDGTVVTARHRVERFPPLELAYGAFDIRRRRLIELEAPGGALPEAGLAHPEFELADLDGQGLPGVLAATRDGHRYWRNLGGGRLQIPRPLTRAPAGVTLADPQVQLADMQGDGRIDLIVSNGRVQGYYPATFDGEWDERSFQPAARSPAVSLADPNVKLVDMDGDGVTDILHTTERDFQIYYNRGASGWAGETEHVPRRPLEEFPDVRLDDPDGHVKIAEMTGDGCSDFVLVRDGRVDYWPHMGRARYGERVTMRGTPRIGHDFDPRRVLIADVDGDGYGDFVYVGYDSVTICINRSGSEWSPPVTISGTPLTPEPDAVRAADMLGTGTSGLLWSFPHEQAPGRNYVFLDLTGGSKPYLLRSVANQLGARTGIEYEPSSAFFVRDMEAGLKWATKLPFPVQCVSRVEMSDEISAGSVVSEYRYHHGCWDGIDREFRGFARVDQWDADRKGGGGRPDPVETRTWYSVGPDALGREPDLSGEYWEGDPPLLERPKETRDLFSRIGPAARRRALRAMRSQVLRSELYGRDGGDRESRPYTVTEYTASLREELAGRVYFPHQVAQRVTQWERGDEPQTDITVLGGLDQYGLVGVQLRVGVPRGRDPRVATGASEPYLTLLTETDYARRDDAAGYIVDRLARVTVSEVSNDGSASVRELIAAALDGTALRRLVSQSVSFFDGPAYVGLPWGQIGEYGALVRQEALTFTDAVLAAAFGAAPPYLRTGSVSWPAEYPADFRSALPAHAGYVRRRAGAGSPYVDGWYAAAERRRYDFHSQAEPARGLVRRRRDPLGRITRIRYDRYGLLPVTIADPIGLDSRLEQDYRVGRMSQLRDQNGNRKRIRYTPLGLVSEVYLTGKLGEGVGDPAGAPSTRYRYDLLAFAERGAPVSIRSESRFRFATDTTASAAQRAQRRVVVEYSDGFGRLLQTRSRAADLVYGDLPSGEGVLPSDPAAADPGARAASAAPRSKPRVQVRAAVVYDGKARPIERYEPYLGEGLQYTEPATEDLGRKIQTTYDVRGHPLRVIGADGAEQCTVYGVPAQLDDPDTYEPTPWEAYSYDQNDNAGRTHPTLSASSSAHRDTPSSTTIDAWGRTVERVSRIGPDPVTERFATSTTFDPLGRPTEVRDALGRVVSRTLYDHLGRVVRTELLDGGVRISLLDADDQSVEFRDGRGALTLHSYDNAGRPRAVWVRDRTGARVCLREWREYGDELPTTQARQANLLGRPVRTFDGAGVVTYPAYDFVGQTVATRRRFIDDSVLLATFDPNDWTPRPVQIDWTPPAGSDIGTHAESLLDQDEHEVDWVHGALGQLVTSTYPADGSGHQAVLEMGYDESGTLSSLELDGRTLVERAYLDGGGRRTLVAYGNGVMTRYAYDALSGRLLRARTESFDRSGDDLLPKTPPDVLSDLVYEHDLVGNVTAIRDLTPGSGVTGSQDPAADAGVSTLLASGDALLRSFGYDPLYRLTAAGGRICDNLPEPPRWRDYDRCGRATAADPTGEQDDAPNATVLYRERYRHDPVGNLTWLERTTPAGTWTRRFGAGGLSPAAWQAAWQSRLGAAGDWQNPPGNSATHVRDPGGPTGKTHDYDARGNLVREAPDVRLEWDAGSRMSAHRRQGRNRAGTWLEPEVCALHLYDGAGTRVKTLVRRSGGEVESSAQVDGIFERRVASSAGMSHVQDLVFVIDGERPVAISRRGGPAGLPSLTLELDDHLGSATLSLDLDSDWRNREEFTAFGETSYGGYEGKRHRFTGAWRDSDSGLACHGARWYSPWLGRFVSCDPAGFADGPNLYRYASSNPLGRVDRTGTVPAPYEVADAWAASPIASSATSLVGFTTGEEISQSISGGAEAILNHAVDALPQGDGFWASAGRNAGLVGATLVKSVADVAGGMVAGALDPGFALRGIMRLGTGSADGVNDISRGNTVLGASKIVGEVSQSILIVTGGAKFGQPKAPPKGPTGTITMYKTAGGPINHLRIGIKLAEGVERVFHQYMRAGKHVGDKPLKGVGKIDKTGTPTVGKRHQGASQTVPLAQAEAALKLAEQLAQTEGKPGFGPGSTNFNLATDNCTTFASKIATTGGVMTPATFPTLSFYLFKANLSGANMATGAAIMGAGGAAGQQHQQQGQ